MPIIAVFAIVAIVLTLTSPADEKAKAKPDNVLPRHDDPKDLLARALDAYIKDQEQQKSLL